jgi:hypothetical protein
MSENRTPEDVQPLARPVHEQELARPVGGEQEETTQVKEGEQQASQEERETSQVEGGQEEKGLIDRAMDKVDEVRHKARNKLADS